MNKAELVSALASTAELSKKDSEKFLKAFEEVVIKELSEGGKIQLVGFMSMEVVDRKEREGRNPRTSETMIIPASKAVRFKAGKILKDSVNK
ncbi:MAG: HU family DNA-binding protein [Defluviitaleaceae bacterium]|nr:HU family DNA-binding protein [Defluviitaleaceae bacterium]